MPRLLQWAEEALRQKRIGLGPADEEFEERLPEKQDRDDDRERQLKAGREKLISVETKNEDRSRRHAIPGRTSAIDEEAAEDKRRHERRANAGGVEAGNRGVEKQRRNNQPDGPASRQSRRASDHPEQLRDNRHVQTGDREEMQRARLLKLLLDFIWRVIANAEHHSADEPAQIRRIFQSARQRRLHPGSRNLGRAHDATAVAAAQNSPIFRIAHDERVTNVLPREVGAHVEFAGIAWTFDGLRDAEQLQLVTVTNIAAPTREQRRRRRFRLRQSRSIHCKRRRKDAFLAGRTSVR